MALFPPVADDEIVELSVKILAERMARKFRCDYKDIKPSVKRAVKDWEDGVFDDVGDAAAVASPDAAGNSFCFGLVHAGASS